MEIASIGENTVNKAPLKNQDKNASDEFQVLLSILASMMGNIQASAGSIAPSGTNNQSNTGLNIDSAKNYSIQSTSQSYGDEINSIEGNIISLINEIKLNQGNPGSLQNIIGLLEKNDGLSNAQNANVTTIMDGLLKNASANTSLTDLLNEITPANVSKIEKDINALMLTANKNQTNPTTKAETTVSNKSVIAPGTAVNALTSDAAVSANEAAASNKSVNTTGTAVNASTSDSNVSANEAAASNKSVNTTGIAVNASASNPNVSVNETAASNKIINTSGTAINTSASDSTIKVTDAANQTGPATQEKENTASQPNVPIVSDTVSKRIEAAVAKPNFPDVLKLSNTVDPKIKKDDGNQAISQLSGQSPEKLSGSNIYNEIKPEFEGAKTISNPQDIVDVVVEKFKALRLPESTELRVKLKPEDLGDITVKVVLEKGQISGSISTEKRDVANMLQGQMDNLKQDLKNNNINLNNISVNVSTDEDLSRFNQRQNNGGNKRNPRRFAADVEEGFNNINTNVEGFNIIA